jgi:hypothetical protein
MSNDTKVVIKATPPITAGILRSAIETINGPKITIERLKTTTAFKKPLSCSENPSITNDVTNSPKALAIIANKVRTKNLTILFAPVVITTIIRLCAA